MRNIFIIFLSSVFLCVVSCSRSALHFNGIIDDAEKVMQTSPDSAMKMLDVIDPSDLTVDSIRAKYYYVKAWGHCGRAARWFLILL